MTPTKAALKARVPDLPPRRAGRPRDERASRAIADAALRQLGDIGYANMSMESVAAEAGVSRTTIYRRYQDKADLITSAIAMGKKPPARSGEPLTDLVGFLEEFDARIAESCLEVVGSLLGTRTDPSAMALHRERVVAPRMADVVALITDARDTGLLYDATDPDLLGQMLVGAVFARRIMGFRAEPGWARRAVETACEGVATKEGLDRLRSATRRRAPASARR